MLVKAFDADPLIRWFVLDDRHRSDRMARLFAWYLGQALPLGLSHTTADCRAAAIWMGPGQWNLSTFQQLCLLPEVLRVVGLRRALSRLHGLNILQRSHPARPHYYLAMLGTDPAFQGRRLGSTVLQAGLSRCDREQMPAYLETAALQTIPFYERHGFRLCGEVAVPHNGPSVRFMWRELNQ
jgi:ribosomal protein S18 acetylase RimI-like enzyme